MNIFSLFFNEILYRPLYNGLIFLYNAIPFHDFGVAIILLTILIRLLVYPLNQKAINSQAEMNKLQPKIKDVQQKFKDDKVKQSQALMDLYKEHKINPASGCLPILIQLPILFALYKVFWNGLNPDNLNILYSFVSRPEQINSMFLGFIDLAKNNYAMAIMAGVLTFFQSKMMMTTQTNTSEKNDFAAMMTKQMLYIMPIMTIFIAWKLPAGLSLYWVVITLFGIVQQYIILKKKKNNE
jgi:YidC/Oxa1 family membrane protein insertase